MSGAGAGAADERYLPTGWLLPMLDEHNEAYFTGGELRLECCAACGHVQHPPTGVCVECQGVDTGRLVVEPDGVLESFTIVHHAVNEALTERVPYNVVIVALRDHPHVRIVGNVIDGTELVIGRALRGSWTGPLGEQQVRLLQWRGA